MTSFNAQRTDQRIDELCDQFEADWRLGRAESIEAMLDRTLPENRRLLLRELLPIELERRVAARERLNLQAWLDRFPADQDLVYHGFQLTEPRPDSEAEPQPLSLRGRVLGHIMQFLNRARDLGLSERLGPAAPFDDVPFDE
ncbi:MAG: hypothetical protein ACK5TO_18345 [Planctomycetaceae bacterium]|jgi:hypothetical protein